jgi:hypothetical protein
MTTTRDITIERVRWAAELPEQVRRLFERLETNLVSAVLNVALKRQPTLAVKRVRTGDTAAFWHLHQCDTSGASVTLLLPQPTAQDAGKVFVATKESGSNNLVMRPIAGKINGAATFTVTTARAYAVYCDGVDYWGQA